MNYKSILFFLGLNCLIITCFSILNILYSLYFDFIIDINSYLITLIISALIGGSFIFLGKNENKNISLTEQILFILLSFIFIPVLISIPYYLSIYNSMNYKSLQYEPLKSILDLTENKQDSIVFFLKDEIKSKMNNYYFYDEKNKDIFINQLIICIKKSDLDSDSIRN